MSPPTATAGAASPRTRSRILSRFKASTIGRRISTKIFQPRGIEVGEVFLNQRRVFILPTRAGLIITALLIALLLGSINYSLSLGFALTFLVTGVAWIGMISTFRNLVHLHLRPLRVEPVFAGDVAEHRLVVRNAAAIDRYAIDLSTFGMARPVACNPAAGAEENVTIAVPTVRRGRQPMPRVTVETCFPLGLWRTWSYWTPDLPVLVYPTPLDVDAPLPFGRGDGREHQVQRVRGSEDFAGLRPYVAGDRVRQIAWRAMARNPEGRVMTKLFDGGASGEVWLTLDAALRHRPDFESALSLLTHWLLTAEAAGLRYGLELSGAGIAPAHGPAHRSTCLEALALAEP